MGDLGGIKLNNKGAEITEEGRLFVVVGVGFLSKWKSGQKSRRKDWCWGFWETGPKSRGGGNRSRRGDLSLGCLSKWKILGSKTKCEDEAKRRKIDCWWVFISGSGRFGHKTNKCE